MYTYNAPSLGAVSCAAKLRADAVKLQNYAELNPGSKAAVLAFWESQKLLAAADNGLPSDGTYVPGVSDLRPVAYRVLSHYRMFNKPGLEDFKAFCQFFIEKNGGQPEVPLSFSKDLTGSNASDADATYVQLGSAYNNSVEVTGGKAPYTYQWFKRSGGVDGKVGTNAPAYNIPSYGTGNNGDYFVQVTDASGKMIESKRDRTRVAINIIKEMPLTAEWTEGAKGELSITSSNGATPHTYQWFKDGKAVEGRTSASFSRAAAAPADAGVYYCIAYSANNRAPKEVKSRECTVTVTSPTKIAATPALQNVVGGEMYFFEELFTVEGAPKSEFVLVASPSSNTTITPDLDVKLSDSAAGKVTLTAHWKRDSTVRAVHVLEGIVPKP